jgi:aryl-alcohol dehydrogenase-like predicted oxidoreductase
MHHRTFNHTGVTVSEIGLGCWQLGGGDWGDVADDQAFAILSAAVDSGVTFLDTADVYGLGRSETLIGKFLKSRAGLKPFIATKLGRFPDPGMPKNFSMNVFRQHTEASLRRLQLDSVDLTQIHCIPTDVMRAGECFDWLRMLKKEGKIRAFGASVESMEEALICLKQEGLASLQIIFNVFRQKPIDMLFDAAQKKGVALIIRLPIASGLLSGKMTKQTHFAPSDHRTYNRDGEAFNVGETFAGLGFERGVEIAEKLTSLVPPGMTMAQMAMRWILDFPAVSVVIPGASRPQQAKENAEISNLPPLSKELHQKLKSFYHEQVAAYVRGPY